MIQRSPMPPTITKTDAKRPSAALWEADVALPQIRASASQLSENALNNDRFVMLRQSLRLPDSLSAFALFMAGLVLVCAGMLLHIWTSSQLMASRLRVAEMREQHAAIEMANAELTWKIAEARSLNDVGIKAAALGYQPAPRPLFVQQYETAKPDASESNPVFSDLRRPDDAIDQSATPSPGWLDYVRSKLTANPPKAVPHVEAQSNPDQSTTWWSEMQRTAHTMWSSLSSVPANHGELGE